MTQAVEFSLTAMNDVEDIAEVARVLSAHVRASWPADFRNEVIVDGCRIRFRVEPELIFVTEALPVKLHAC